MRDRQTCVGCGKKSPETDTNYTLISAQFGWRLARLKGADGAIIVEWRCPACWREYKLRTHAGPESTTVRNAPAAVPLDPFRPRTTIPATNHEPASGPPLPLSQSLIEPPPPPPRSSTHPPMPTVPRSSPVPAGKRGRTPR